MLHSSLRRRFASDGYLVLRGAVSSDRVRATRRRIEASLQADQRLGTLPQQMADTFCRDLTAHPDVLDLFERGRLRQATAALFDDEAFRAPRAQIALRFPERRAAPVRPTPHLDGFPTDENAVRTGTIHRPSAVAGVFLTHLRSSSRGNLAVWPGSHLHFERFFRARDLPAWLAREGPARVLDAIGREPLGDPLEITAAPGDAVLLHPMLAHGVASNLSLHTREAVYFRVVREDDDPADPTPLLDRTRFFRGVSW